MSKIRRVLAVAAVVLLLSMAIVGAASAYTVTITTTPYDDQSGHGVSYTATAGGVVVEVTTSGYVSAFTAENDMEVVITASCNNSVVRQQDWNVSTNVKYSTITKDYNTVTFTMPEGNVNVGVTEGKLLPNEYNEVVYIENTGTQYINPNVTLNSSLKMRLDVERTGWVSGSGGCGIIGVGGTDSMGFLSSFRYFQSDGKVKFYKIGDSNYTFEGDFIDGRHVLVNDYTTKTASIDDEIHYGTVNQSGSNYKMYLFAYSRMGSPDVQYGFKGRMYSVIFWDNGNKIRDFIPCIRKSDKVVGMYDTVNGAFYENKGSGSFTGGYKVIYDGNGAISGTVPAAQEITTGSYATIADGSTLTGPESKKFAGWNTVQSPTSDNPGVMLYPGQSVCNAGNMTLYAQWTESQVYTIAYNANEGTGGTVPMDSTAYNSGDPVTVNDNTGNLTRTNYYFAGWNTQKDGKGTTYLGPEGSSSFKITGNTVLYAKWVTSPVYKITYDGNGSDEGTTPACQYYVMGGTAATVSGNTGNLTKEGYYFAGWNTNAQGTGTNYKGGTTLSIYGNTILYSQWNGEKTTVTLEKNAYDATAPSPGSVTETHGFAVAGVTFTTSSARTGYILDGWYTASSGGSKILNADGTAVGTKVDGWVDADGNWIYESENATLYAHWTDALKYYVYIPSGVTLQSTPVEGTYKIKILTQGGADGKSIVLRYSSSAHAEGSTKYITLGGDSSEKMSYTVTKPGSSTDIQSGTEIVSLSTSSAAGTEESMVLTYSGVNSTGKKAGSYSDTLTFTVNVEKQMTLQLTGGIWYDTYHNVITSVDVQEGSLITVDEDTVTFARFGYNDVVVTHEGLAGRNLFIGSSSDDERLVETGTTTVRAADTTLRCGLPFGYTEVEYIESTGTQWINTGISTSTKLKMEYVSELTGWASASSTVGIIGVGGAATGTSNICCSFRFYKNPEKLTTDVVNGMAGDGYKFNTSINGKHVMILDMLNKQASVDGEVKTWTGTSFGTSYEIYLFAYRQLDHFYHEADFVGRMYSVKFWENNTLVRDFIPCINPLGTVGMYDMVNRVFYENSGSGVFIAGDPVS